MDINRNHRSGSSLLLVVSMIVLMVTVATAFLTTMSRQRGTAFLLAARTRCEIGMEQATARITRQLLEEYTDPSRTYSWRNGSQGSEWHRQCVPVGNDDGDIWTDDGTPLSAGYNDTDNMVNIGGGVDLTDMMQRSTGDSRSNYYGFWTQYRGTRARWHNMTFYDDRMQPIEIDESLSELDKADIRREARYVLRYAVVNIDCEGQVGANNNYPNAPISFNGSNAEEYNRYQSYLRHFGRSIKSMTAGTASRDDMRQFRSDNGDFCKVRDPYDFENLAVFPDGIKMDWSGDNDVYGMGNDLRLRRESAFRMDARTWVERSNGIDTKSPHMAGFGRLTTWYQIGRKNGGTGMGGAYYAPHFQFTPYAGSMLGEPLKSVNPDACTVPWKINLLTCTDFTRQAVWKGMSSHIKTGKGAAYNIDHRTKPSWWSNATSANADIFGPGYPEAFPLGIEDGKDIPLAGMVNKSIIPEYHWKNYSGRSPQFYGGALNYSDENRYPASALSYWVDIHKALGMVASRCAWAWQGGGGISTSSREVRDWDGSMFLMKNPETGADILGPNGDSYIDKSETDTDTMLSQVIMETCRVLGEGYIKPHAGALPATSWNKYNHASPGLLAGGVSYVGLNMVSRGDHILKRCQLSPQTNKRGMEYALNDVLISLYGKANPYYEEGVDQLQHIAVDFNGDGYAESTVSGWYNPDTDARTWSWWWNGFGPEGRPVNGDWMKQGGWIRFHEDQRIERQRGAHWIELTAAEKTEFLDCNDIFLYDRWSVSRGPIRPFSHTGRFFIGKSRVFQSFVRTEILNIPKRQVIAAANRSFVYCIDPDKNGSFEDSHVATHQEFDMKNTDL